MVHLCWRGSELGRGHPRDSLHAEAAGPGAAVAALTVGLAPPEMFKGVNLERKWAEGREGKTLT